MANFTGSLLGKRKADLVEIATALGLPDTEGRLVDLRERIQVKLDEDSATLREDPTFKGLYRRGRHHDSDESPAPDREPKTPRVRKSINKALDRVAEAANVPLPESPVSIAKVAEDANQALAVVESDAKDLMAHIKKRAGPVIKHFKLDEHKATVEGWIRDTHDVLSTPSGLLTVALAIEGAFLYHHVAPFNRYAVSFPPEDSESGTLASLFRGVFFWSPRWSWTFTYPTYNSFFPGSALWPAVAWWAFATILPPLVLSTLVSFVPQAGVHRAGRTTRYQAANPPTPSVDELTFAIFRFAILLVPFTNAAPDALVDALDMSGNAQARALGAGLLAGLMLAQRLGAERA